MKIKMVCSNCRGENVLSDAYARWNVKKQKWEVAMTFDKGACCEDCGKMVRIEEEEIE